MFAYEIIRKGHRPSLRDNGRPRRLSAPWLVSAVLIIGSAVMLQAWPLQAQQPQWQPQSGNYVQCPAPNQPLLRIPEIVSQKVEGKDYGILRGTILLSGAEVRMYLAGKAQDPSQCQVQLVRQFKGFAADGKPAALPEYPGTIPFGYEGYTKPPSYTGNPPFEDYQDPVPGPTLRARVGDIVELTFLNQIGGNVSWKTLDRGEKNQGKEGCDKNFTTASAGPKNIYPGIDNFPDCLHGSTTGNIHFHGTHTNPQTTGDNVFIEVRPSLRDEVDKPLVTAALVKPEFDTFFADCERELNKSVLSQWPTKWSDMPPLWRAMQEYMLRLYDLDPEIVSKLWPVDEALIKAGVWPQYYIGGSPYCFRLPKFTGPYPPTAAAHPAAHGLMMERPEPPLQMGQAPGTHWYHAHKHGSTTINVENGMTGAFIIEGDSYDGALNGFYGDGWARKQPVLVVNQLGTGLNLFGGPGSTVRVFSVNGRIQPSLTMQGGEVQLWRIANTSARGGVFIVGFGDNKAPSQTQVFTWRETAQDGVQLNGANYWNSKNLNALIAPGNRVDLLVQAPTAQGQYVLWVKEVTSTCETLPANKIPLLVPGQAGSPPICPAQNPVPLLTVNVTNTLATGNTSQFIPQDQVQAAFPAFLKDITDDKVKATKTVEFESLPSGASPRTRHLIDGVEFNGDIGEVVLLNSVEEWKIVNKTINGKLRADNKPVVTDPPRMIDHPFHIHINPFQIVEVFDPNQQVRSNPNDPNSLIPKYVTDKSGMNPAIQCFLDINDPSTWHDCHNAPDGIWWDVFPIPSARAIFTTVNGTNQLTKVPGYFRMRTRFVDYSGQFVMHCHILVHEDRGMMNVVEVVPFTTPYSHQ
jgi:FtsP/CotA-like multicopper oxidase with cupredoxin domain